MWVEIAYVLATGVLVLGSATAGAWLGWAWAGAWAAGAGAVLGIVALAAVAMVLVTAWDQVVPRRPRKVPASSECCRCLCQRCAAVLRNLWVVILDEGERDALGNPEICAGVARRLHVTPVRERAVVAVQRSVEAPAPRDPSDATGSERWADAVLSSLGYVNRVVVTEHPELVAMLCELAGIRWAAWCYDPVFAETAQALARRLPPVEAVAIARAALA